MITTQQLEESKKECPLYVCEEGVLLEEGVCSGSCNICGGTGHQPIVIADPLKECPKCDTGEIHRHAAPIKSVVDYLQNGINRRVPHEVGEKFYCNCPNLIEDGSHHGPVESCKYGCTAGLLKFIVFEVLPNNKLRVVLE